MQNISFLNSTQKFCEDCCLVIMTCLCKYVSSLYPIFCTANDKLGGMRGETGMRGMEMKEEAWNERLGEGLRMRGEPGMRGGEGSGTRD